MKKTLATVACALVVIMSLSVVPGSSKLGIFGVDVVSAATGETPATPTKTTTTTTVSSSTATKITRLLALNSVGGDVKLLQTWLNNNGSSLKVDGIYGKLTLAAVKSYQSKNGLVVDGIVGPKTLAKLTPVVVTPPVVTPPVTQQSSIKIGRTEFNAHGSGFVVAVVAMAGDKIAKVSVDEYQFMDPTLIAEPLPNTAKLGANYKDATKSVLASKLKNTAYYSANMQKSGGATQSWDANMAGVEKFATGKTIAELDAAIKANKNADGTDMDPKVDAVTSATFASTNGYLSAILEAAQNAAKASTSVTVDTAQLNNLKIGRTEYNAHGSGFVVAAALTLADKIIADSVDEYQFMDPTLIAEPLPNTAKLGANYKDATKSVLASKLKNTAYYSANMQKSGGATQSWDVNMAGVEKFAIGKTVAELDAAIKGNKNADGTDKDAKVDAVASATFASTNGYLSSIEEAAKAAK